MVKNARHAACFLAAVILPVFILGQGCPPVPVDDDSSSSSDDQDTTGDDNQDSSSEPESRHEVIFSQILTAGYQDTDSCLTCHGDKGEEILETGHWKWQGVAERIEGYETGIHGKQDLLNNFCIAVPSNEARCTQCHPGIGWRDTSFDLTDPSNIDCLVCHDQSGQYTKDPKQAGAPAEGVDLQQAAMSVGPPTRANCGSCHFFAGGGDNVKHGDLSSDLVSPTQEMDVHMAADGLNFQCQTCHFTNDHQISGMPLHSVGEGLTDCTTCHGSADVHEEAVLNLHLNTVACQTCHIPAIARSMPTKVEWYWDEAGQDIDPIPTDPYGKATYDKKKGRFVWAMNVRPELKWFNGKWKRMMVGVNDTYTATPVVLAEPVGDITDVTAKLYPFKKMIGRQPADSADQRILVPHLFPGPAGPNAYWKAYDWDLALSEGAAYAGQPYSGEYTFVDTVMYLSVNHEVAPASQALDCEDCHAGGIDFVALGFDEDPWSPSR